MSSPSSSRGAVRSAFLAVLLALVAGCTATTSTERSPGSAADHGDRPVRASAAPSSPRPGPPDVDRVDAEARRLDRAVTAALAKCMRTQGHPQLAETMSVRDTGPRLRRPVLGVHAAELGPTSAAQAEAYGMLGTGLLFTDPPLPIVESSAAAYDTALTGCLSDLPDGQMVHERLAGWRTLTNELRQDLLTRVDPPLRQILRRQLGCVRRTGYPALSLDTFLDGDTRTALRALQIPVGTFSAAPADPPPLPPDATRVVPAPPEQTYTPTPAEVAFARTYVRCGRVTGLESALARVVDPAAEELGAAHASDVEFYAAYLADRLSDLGAPR